MHLLDYLYIFPICNCPQRGLLHSFCTASFISVYISIPSSIMLCLRKDSIFKNFLIQRKKFYFRDWMHPCTCGWLCDRMYVSSGTSLALYLTLWWWFWEYIYKLPSLFTKILFFHLFFFQHDCHLPWHVIFFTSSFFILPFVCYVV